MKTIQIRRQNLDRAISASDKNGGFYLLEDGSIHWQDHVGGFPLPDNAIVSIPVYDPDGSGAFLESCQESYRSKYGDKEYEKLVDSDKCVIEALEKDDPDAFKGVVSFLKEEAIHKLELSLESYYILDENGLEIPCPYSLDVI